MKTTVYNACDLLDTASAKSLLGGRRLGLVTNMSGVTRDLKTTSSVMKQRYDLCALFGPEHGIRGAAQAGGHDNESFCDPETGVPVYDLFAHGDAREKTGAVLSSLDAVVFDIQDIGVRFYTYISVLARAMKLCAKCGIPMVVLDRYNPLGLTKVSGTLLDETYSSFVGMYELPSRHAMTVGEYAQYINVEKAIHCQLHVIPCTNLSRTDGWYRPTHYPPHCRIRLSCA